MITVVVAEPNRLLRDGIVALLEIEKRFEVVAAVAQARELFSAAAVEEPQVILFDPPVSDTEVGVRLVRRLIEVAPQSRLILLTAQTRAEFIDALLRAGAHACVLKHEGKAELFRAIATSMRGGRHRSPATVGCLKAVAVTAAHAAIGCQRALSDREREVLQMIAAGARTREIAAQLSLSVKTIEKHRANITHKLGLRGVAGVTAYAIQRGIVRAAVAEH